VDSATNHLPDAGLAQALRAARGMKVSDATGGYASALTASSTAST